jgi:hypothetical protein
MLEHLRDICLLIVLRIEANTQNKAIQMSQNLIRGYLMEECGKFANKIIRRITNL